MARHIEEEADEAQVDLDADEVVERLMAEWEARLRDMGVRLPPGGIWAEPEPERLPRWLELLASPLVWVIRKIDDALAARTRARQRAEMEEMEEEMADFEIPPPSEETLARLRAYGVRIPARGGPVPDFEPGHKRPPWLAFLFRTLRANT